MLFDGRIGKYNGIPYTANLKDNVMPYNRKPYKSQQLYEAPIKRELECLVKLGMLKKINHSE